MNGPLGSIRSFGKSAISCTWVAACNLRHVTHFDMCLATAEPPPIIQQPEDQMLASVIPRPC